MFKKLILALMLALPFAVSAQNVKIGLVDTQTLLMAMPETKAAETELKALQDKYDGESKKLESEYNRKLEELNALPADTGKAIVEQKQQDIIAYQNSIRNFLQKADQDLQSKQQELMSPIIQKVQGAIQSVGAEGQYTLLCEKGVALYFSGAASDITDLVKTKLGIK